MPMWQSFAVKRGQLLSVGATAGGSGQPTRHISRSQLAGAPPGIICTSLQHAHHAFLQAAPVHTSPWLAGLMCLTTLAPSLPSPAARWAATRAVRCALATCCPWALLVSVGIAPRFASRRASLAAACDVQKRRASQLSATIAVLPLPLQRRTGRAACGRCRAARVAPAVLLRRVRLERGCAARCDGMRSRMAGCQPCTHVFNAFHGPFCQPHVSAVAW